MVIVDLQSPGTRSSVREGFGSLVKQHGLEGPNKSSSPGVPQVDLPISSCYLTQSGAVSTCDITKGAVAFKSIMALEHLDESS